MAGPGMKGRIVGLGGASRLGRAAAEAFKSAGWQVASLVRGSAAGSAAPGTEIIEVDARDGEAVIAATSGADVILHALNVPYADWERLALPLADTAIAAARESRATLIFPGNLYNYGAGIPARIDETTAMHPTSRKGAIRVAIETRMHEAAEGELRTIVLRAGDYLGGEGRGSWFDRIIVKGIAAGRLTYPGPLDTMHEWAYLPDVAQAMVQLAERRERLAPFATPGFARHAVTAREFLAAVSRACRRDFKIDFVPWRLLKMMGVVVPVFRELTDICYLWSPPAAIDRARLTEIIGDIPPTPPDQAIVASPAGLGPKRRGK